MRGEAGEKGSEDAGESAGEAGPKSAYGADPSVQRWARPRLCPHMGRVAEGFEILRSGAGVKAKVVGGPAGSGGAEIGARWGGGLGRARLGTDRPA